MLFDLEGRIAVWLNSRSFSWRFSSTRFSLAFLDYSMHLLCHATQLLSKERHFVNQYSITVAIHFNHYVTRKNPHVMLQSAFDDEFSRAVENVWARRPRLHKFCVLSMSVLSLILRKEVHIWQEEPRKSKDYSQAHVIKDISWQLSRKSHSAQVAQRFGSPQELPRWFQDSGWITITCCSVIEL